MSNPSHPDSPILVCFAVKEEAAPFKPRADSRNVKILVTGMGRSQAEQAIRTALASEKPNVVFTCGFAGGLRPGLETGTVLFDAGGSPKLYGALTDAGARPGRFHCSARVLVTAQEKQELHAASGADAVEMESQVIAIICRELDIPCAVVRVILDPAEEDLALDFNQLIDANQNLHYGKLIAVLLRKPSKLIALLRLQRQSAAAAKKLATVLERALAQMHGDVKRET